MSSQEAQKERGSIPTKESREDRATPPRQKKAAASPKSPKEYEKTLEKAKEATTGTRGSSPEDSGEREKPPRQKKAAADPHDF